jgi:flagellar biosynthetic protein FliR
MTVLDPQSGAQVSITDQLAAMVALAIFLAFNGHHTVISTIAESFDLVDVGLISLKPQLLAQTLAMTADMFVLSIKMGAPAIAALLFTSAAFGVCARFVPQMNILIAAFPVKIIVGLVFLGVMFQIIMLLTESYLGRFPALLGSLLLLMSNR